MAGLPDKVHLVGSVNLDTAADVFCICGRALGRRLRRIPDGETGPRRVWLMWQYWMFVSHPALQRALDVTDAPFAYGTFRLAEGADPADLHFGALGYAHAAKASYLDIRQLCEAVPRDVEVGVHLCYGDPDGRHLFEPRDAGKEVAFANAIASAITRPLTFLHMPVPINRFDDEFCRPLANLKLNPKTEFYLGLVHPDGKENMRKRLELADRYISDYGIASECGISRARTREVTMKFLQAYADNSREL
jgi:hypothetical protein